MWQRQDRVFHVTHIGLEAPFGVASCSLFWGMLRFSAITAALRRAQCRRFLMQNRFSREGHRCGYSRNANHRTKPVSRETLLRLHLGFNSDQNHWLPFAIPEAWNTNRTCRGYTSPSSVARDTNCMRCQAEHAASEASRMAGERFRRTSGSASPLLSPAVWQQYDNPLVGWNQAMRSSDSPCTNLLPAAAHPVDFVAPFRAVDLCDSGEVWRWNSETQSGTLGSEQAEICRSLRALAEICLEIVKARSLE